jgi:predicted dehydrogenase
MKISRRDFVKSSAVFSGLAFLPNTVFGANERLNVAFVGVGGKGGNLLKRINGKNKLNVVAFADVDDQEAAGSVKRYPNVPIYRDFRVMLDKHDKDIEAVVISTPDHTHHYIAMNCMARGKHVYLEKPLAHNISEVRDLMNAEKKYGLKCQMGNQGHSGMGMAMVRKWVDQGVLGDITEVSAWCNPVWGRGGIKRPVAQPIPKTLDWDMWLGSAAKVGYNSAYCPSIWRGWNEFGSGSLGDWGCHNMDAPYDALGLDCPSEVKIESTGPSKLSFPESMKLTYTFPPTEKRGKVILKWYDGNKFKPERPEGMDPNRKMGNAWGGTIIVGSKATLMTGTHAGTPRIVPETLQIEMA